MLSQALSYRGTLYRCLYRAPSTEDATKIKRGIKMDALSRVERMYGSVTEYGRCMEEEYYDEEKESKVFDMFQANSKKLEEAYRNGLPTIWCGGYGACKGCEYADNDTMEHYDDDRDIIICSNPSCDEHVKVKKVERRSLDLRDKTDQHIYTDLTIFHPILEFVIDTEVIHKEGYDSVIGLDGRILRDGEDPTK